MEKNKVSIIIPVYNSEKYLKECMESIMAQTFTQYECILVDDKSKDKSPKMCDFYSSKDKRVKVLHNIKNIGSSLSRKAGLDISNGTYIQFIDSDDWIEKNMLEKVYEKAVSGNYDIIYCDAFIESFTGVSKYEKLLIEDNTIAIIKRCIFGFNDGAGLQFKFVKKNLYENLVFPKNGYAEDKYITTQLLYKAKSIGIMNSAFYHVRKNPDSQMRNQSTKAKIHRYTGLKNNFKMVFDFLKMIYGNNLEIFEPELSIRIKNINKTRMELIKHIVKKILKMVMPFKSGRKLLRNIYHKIIH